MMYIIINDETNQIITEVNLIGDAIEIIHSLGTITHTETFKGTRKVWVKKK